MTNDELLALADRFYMGKTQYYPFNDIWVVNRQTKDTDKQWAITSGGSCFTTEGYWAIEPLPSSRDDDWFQRSRYTRDEAIILAQRLINQNMEEPNGEA